ncbi:MULTISPECIES: class I SAM-dependent methyltransferase [unclassified Mesorhizobium]|uniref:SAM-dependent methyltransferase n=1 Tax=unclassified Mesorhizobium TaxID=325217 RepID=UPI00167AACF4|nr:MULTISPECIES: class I SAM-dependent methyltransferase [unclassified Mesorhizobium]
MTAEDLSPVDEFHIGGRAATAELAAQLALTAGDRVLDIGCGLGGPARQIAAQYGCQASGIDLTRDYVEAGNVLSGWLHVKERKSALFSEVARVLPTDARFGVFDAAYHRDRHLRRKRPGSRSRRASSGVDDLTGRSYPLSPRAANAGQRR